jgi:methyltransferase (TIGR00027 family)
MSQAAAKTGLGPTATVAMEQAFPAGQRIVDDPTAYRIMPASMRGLAAAMRVPFLRDWFLRTSERAAPGLWAAVLCRKRYIDEKVTEAVGTGEIDALVNLGAGFDTRAFRLPALAQTPVWEVDQAENVAAKREGLRRVFGEAPARVTLVPVDFDREALGDALAAHGWDAGARTFFVLEAVTQYLSAAGLRATFDFLAGAAPGSRLAFTYVRKDFIEGRALYGHERLYKQYVEPGIWLTGLDPAEVPAFLAGYGWRVLEQPANADLLARYVTPTGRKLASTLLEQVVVAGKG